MTKEKQPLSERVLRYIREQHLISSHQPLVVAVSGGPDSVCLLHILSELREESGARLHVAHLNHQLRSAESDADAQYVSDLAHRLDIPATIEKRDVKGYKARAHVSLEEAARDVRYNFLTRVAKSIGADRAAVGHTTDDHIETILMHLIRGSGTRGLRGLQPYTEWKSEKESLGVIRPLLKITREETVDYCHHHKLEPRMDTSNLSLSSLRNRIRLQLLPLLRGYNPRVDEALLRTARIASDDHAFLDEEIALLWDEVVQEKEGTIILDRERFGQLPLALKRHLLRASIEKVSGNIRDIETRHIDKIMAALTKQAGKSLNLPGGLIFSIDYTKYLLSQDPAALSPFPTIKGEVSLEIPGETSLPGWHTKATIINREQMAEKGIGLIDNDFTAYFDLNKTGDKLVVRTRQPADRFQPLGMSQSKKLGEFMIDAKITHAWREQIPVVCSPQHILWVVGWRIDERAKVTEDTKRVLCLEFEQI